MRHYHRHMNKHKIKMHSYRAATVLVKKNHQIYELQIYMWISIEKLMDSNHCCHQQSLMDNSSFPWGGLNHLAQSQFLLQGCMPLVGNIQVSLLCCCSMQYISSSLHSANYTCKSKNYTSHYFKFQHSCYLTVECQACDPIILSEIFTFQVSNLEFKTIPDISNKKHFSCCQPCCGNQLSVCPSTKDKGTCVDAQSPKLTVCYYYSMLSIKLWPMITDQNQHSDIFNHIMNMSFS